MLFREQLGRWNNAWEAAPVLNLDKMGCFVKSEKVGKPYLRLSAPQGFDQGPADHFRTGSAYG